MTQKVRKLRGNKTGYGHKKKHRGGGNRGGRGNAGMSKHKLSYAVKHGLDTPNRRKTQSFSKKTETLSLNQVEYIALKQGKSEVDLKEYKILGSGRITKPLKITALKFSRKALEKIEKAGGKANSLEGNVEEDLTEKTASGAS